MSEVIVELGIGVAGGGAFVGGDRWKEEGEEKD